MECAWSSWAVGGRACVRQNHFSVRVLNPHGGVVLPLIGRPGGWAKRLRVWRMGLGLNCVCRRWSCRGRSCARRFRSSVRVPDSHCGVALSYAGRPRGRARWLDMGHCRRWACGGRSCARQNSFSVRVPNPHCEVVLSITGRPGGRAR